MSNFMERNDGPAIAMRGDMGFAFTRLKRHGLDAALCRAELMYQRPGEKVYVEISPRTLSYVVNRDYAVLEWAANDKADRTEGETEMDIMHASYADLHHRLAENPGDPDRHLVEDRIREIERERAAAAREAWEANRLPNARH